MLLDMNRLMKATDALKHDDRNKENPYIYGPLSDFSSFPQDDGAGPTVGAVDEQGGEYSLEELEDIGYELIALAQATAKKWGKHGEKWSKS